MNNWRKESNFIGPLSMSWDITNKCNFNCFHCLNRSGDNNIHSFCNELKIKNIDECIRQIIEISPEQICLCGGEPTLNPNIFHIIEKLSSANIKVNMVTNGSKLTEVFVEKLKKAGLNYIQISLDSNVESEHDNFRVYKGSFQKVCQGILNVKKFNIPFAISMCPTSFNCDHFKEYIEFIKKLGCKQLRLMPLLPMGRGLDNFKKIEPSVEQYELLKYQIFKFNSDELNIEWGDPLDHIHKAIYGKRSYPVSVEIKSNGDIGCSIYLPIVVGNIKKHTLKEYWEAGLDSIWSHPDVVEIARKVETIEDFKKLSLQTWSIDRKEIDIIDD